MTKEQILEEYYANNAKKLRSLIDGILKQFGGLSEKDYADFYSIGNANFMDILNRYNMDSKTSFHSYLFICLSNKIRTEITKRNRHKRTDGKPVLSLDNIIRKDEDGSFIDTIISPFNTEEEVINKKHLSSSMVKYLTQLTPLERKILILAAQQYSSDEICVCLKITITDYRNHWNIIKSYEKTRVLYAEG